MMPGDARWFPVPRWFPVVPGTTGIQWFRGSPLKGNPTGTRAPAPQVLGSFGNHPLARWLGTWQAPRQGVVQFWKVCQN